MAVSSIYGIERAMNQLWHNHFYHKPARCDCTVVQYAKIGFYFNATRWRPFLWRHKRYFIAIKMAAQMWEIWKITLWPPLYKILDPPLGLVCNKRYDECTKVCYVFFVLCVLCASHEWSVCCMCYVCTYVCGVFCVCVCCMTGELALLFTLSRWWCSQWTVLSVSLLVRQEWRVLVSTDCVV